ncbi:MAG TPA: hypothetical protein PLV92_27475, partial [Pirellulaceae bacterium]|nr:hypothetical protein [Pirellulaceae bacterium]
MPGDLRKKTGTPPTIRRGPETLGYSRFKWMLVALAVGLSVAFFAFFIFSSKQSADQAQRNAERQMANIAALLADQAQQAFAGVRLSLATAAAEIAGEKEPPALNRILHGYTRESGVRSL